MVLNGEPELLEVVDARVAAGGFAGGLHGGQQQRDQGADDGDDHQQLNECEAAGRSARRLEGHG
jgi:hypothetical protein